MRRSRILLASLVALTLAVAGALMLSGGSAAKPSKSQQLFRTSLLGDAKTTTAVKRLLRDRGGFVAPDIEFADITADGRSDAVVSVDTAGAAGRIAVYVFSTDGKAADSPLRVIYRSQRLYRASAEVSKGTLTLRAPRYAAGDDLCCPAKTVERTYVWSTTRQRFSRRSSRELDGSPDRTQTTATTPPG